MNKSQKLENIIYVHGLENYNYFLIVPVTFLSGVFSLVYLAIFETLFLAFIALKEQEETRGK